MMKSTILVSTNGASHSEAVQKPSEPSGIDHLGNYPKRDQAVAGYIVGRLMLAGVLSCSSLEDQELIGLAMVETAKALRVIPDELGAQDWPHD